MEMNYGNMGGGGLDLANLLGTMMKNNDEFGNGSGSWLWFFMMLLLFDRNGGWNNGANGFNNPTFTDAVEAAVNKARANELSDQVVLQAVNGNGAAIDKLAVTLNSDYNTIQTILGQLGKSIDSVGNQVGLTSQQVINAIQLGNQNLIQQMCTCCCDQKQIMTAGFGDIKATMIDKSNAAVIQNMQQTTELSGVMNAGFALMGQRFTEQSKEMVKGFQEIKDMMCQDKIATLQDKVLALQNAQSNAAQTAAITGFVNSQLAPMQNAINVLYERSTPAPIPAYVVANPKCSTIPTCPCGGA